MPSPQALYQKAHQIVRTTRGHASEHYCNGFLEPCGKTAQEWAFIERGLGSFEVTWTEVKDGKVCEVSRTTSMNPFSYEPMCRRCHVLHDRHLANVLKELAHETA